MAERQDPSDNLHCPMCMDVLAHAITTSCGHTFCGKHSMAIYCNRFIIVSSRKLCI